MNYLYSALAGIALIVAAFFYGEHVQAQADKGKAAVAEVKQDSKLNTLTQTHTLAAATHVQAVQASGTSLHRDIARTFSGATHATPQAAAVDPLDTAAFVLCYNAGSRAERACEAGDVLPHPAPHPQPPPG